jgi:outer membrane protein
MIQTRKLYLPLSIFSLGFFLLHFCAMAQNSLKIGVVDTQGVVESYKKSQAANSVLQTAVKRLRDKLKGLQEEIVNMEDSLTKQKLFLDESATQTLESDILRKRQEYQRELEAGQSAVQEKESELLTPIFDQIQALIQQVGTSESYSLILEKRLVTLYVDPMYDLTDEIIERLNAEYDQETSSENDKSSVPPESKGN